MCSEGEGVKKKYHRENIYIFFFLTIFLCLLRTVCASLTPCDMLEEGQSGQGQVVRVSARLAHKEPPAFSIPLSSGSPSQRTCKQPLRSSTHFISPPLYEAAAFPRPCAALCCCPPRGGHLWSSRASKRSVRERALKGAFRRHVRAPHLAANARACLHTAVSGILFFFIYTRCAHMQVIQELWCFARVQTVMVSVCLLMSSNTLTNGPSDPIICIHHRCTSFFFRFIPRVKVSPRDTRAANQNTYLNVIAKTK